MFRWSAVSFLIAPLLTFSCFASAAPEELGSLGAGSTSFRADNKCEGGVDPEKVATCGFDAQRDRMRAKGKGCFDELYSEIVCKESMWSGLGLQDRVGRVVSLSRKHFASRNADYRVMPCIARRESMYIDPAMVTAATCEVSTTDQGLGQVTFTTFKDLVDNFNFRSRVSPFNRRPYTEDARLLFSAMALSAELQIEVAAEVFRVKLRTAKGDYQRALMLYNGGSKRESYASDVNACYECVKKKIAATGDDAAKVNINSCLDFAVPGNGVEYSYAKQWNRCRGNDPDTWKWKFWLDRGIAPWTMCLNRETRKPIADPTCVSTKQKLDSLTGEAVPLPEIKEKTAPASRLRSTQ